MAESSPSSPSAAAGSTPTVDLWIALHGKVYDISAFVKEHPGGEGVLRKYANSDASAAFDRVGHSTRAAEILAPLRILPPPSLDPRAVASPGEQPSQAGLLGLAQESEDAQAVVAVSQQQASLEVTPASPNGDPRSSDNGEQDRAKGDDGDVCLAAEAADADAPSPPPDQQPPQAKSAAITAAVAADTPPSRPPSGRTPQTRRVPLIGNTLSMNLTNPHQTFLRMARSHHGGAGVFRVDFGLFRNPMQIVVDAAQGADILQREGADFGKGPGYNAIHSVTPFHLLVTEGETAAPRRALIELCLAEAVEKHEAAVARAVASFAPKEGVRVEVSEMLRLLALDVMATLLLGGPLSQQGGAEGKAGPRFVCDLQTTMSEWHHRVTDVVGLWRYMKTPRVRKAEAALARVLGHLDAAIAAAAEPAPTDSKVAADADALLHDDRGGHSLLLNLMVSRGLADEVVRDTCFTMLAMGHENVATCMSWAIYLLARHPESQERVRQEVKAAVTGDKHLGDAENKLPYLEAVLKETVRLYPSIPMLSRQHLRSEDIHVDGYTIPGKVREE